MNSLYVEGMAPIKGEITISGNKNAVLPMIAAALLTEEKVILRNAPNILDVRVMLEVVETLGADVSFDKNIIEIEAKNLPDQQLMKIYVPGCGLQSFLPLL